jgi:hypothetical protein
MKTYGELIQEIERLDGMRNLDENGVTVKLITMIALEWAAGKNGVAPSQRLVEVSEEMEWEGVIDFDQRPD